MANNSAAGNLLGVISVGRGMMAKSVANLLCGTVANECTQHEGLHGVSRRTLLDPASMALLNTDDCSFGHVAGDYSVAAMIS
jgi:hypothetical protein